MRCSFLHLSRRFSALLLLAAVLTGIQVIQAQAPDTDPDSSPATKPTSTQASLQSPATPEQVGDALMVHQRYQAAIAAYKQAPKNSANTWNKMGIAYQMMFNLEEASRCDSRYKCEQYHLPFDILRPGQRRKSHLPRLISVKKGARKRLLGVPKSIGTPRK